MSVKILVVDDHAETLSALGRLLRLVGYDVRSADGYQTALALARLEAFDLILSDIHLWDGDGCNLLVELRRLPGLDGIPAIAISGYGTADDIQCSLDAGFLTHLVKPVHYEQLRQTIEQALLTQNQIRITFDMATATAGRTGM
jgi:CheY-like chemotaxis protein